MVVLPLVPVMPTTRNAVDGSPCTAAATGPSATPRVVDDELVDVGAHLVLGERMVDEQRRRPGGHGRRGEGVAVVVVPRRQAYMPRSPTDLESWVTEGTRAEASPTIAGSGALGRRATSRSRSSASVGDVIGVTSSRRTRSSRRGARCRARA